MMKCDICGGSLMMQTGGIAECELCGMKYSAECLRERMQGTKDTKPVEMDASGEKEQLLKNAETFMSLKKFYEARKVYRELIQKYPDDYRGWWGAFKSYQPPCADDFLGEDVKIALQLNPLLEEEYNEILKDALDGGGLCMQKTAEPCLALPPSHPLRVAYEKGLPYVDRFNRIIKNPRYGNYEERVWRKNGLDDVVRDDFAKCIYVLGNTVGFHGDYGTYYSRKLPRPIEEVLVDLEKAFAQVQSWKANHKCVECGGEIKRSFFSDDQCKNCGQKY